MAESRAGSGKVKGELGISRVRKCPNDIMSKDTEADLEELDWSNWGQFEWIRSH